MNFVSILINTILWLHFSDGLIFPVNNGAIPVSQASPPNTLTDKWQFWLSITIIIVLILVCLGLKLHRYLKIKSKMRQRFEAKKDQVPKFYFESPPSYSQIFHTSPVMENNFFNHYPDTIVTPRSYDMFFAYPLTQLQNNQHDQNDTAQSELNLNTFPCNAYEGEFAEKQTETADSPLKAASSESKNMDFVLKTTDSTSQIEMELNIEIQA